MEVQGCAWSVDQDVGFYTEKLSIKLPSKKSTICVSTVVPEKYPLGREKKVGGWKLGQNCDVSMPPNKDIVATLRERVVFLLVPEPP